MNPVLIEKVKQELRTLRLKDMAEALEEVLEQAHDQSHLQFFSQLVQRQLQGVQGRSLQRRIQKAEFPPNMSFDNFDWGFQPSLNVEYLKDLQELGFVANRQPLLILGKTGCGKTHIAASLGIKACEGGCKVQFYTFQKLLSLLYATLADESTDEMISRLARLDLLIIDHVDYIRSKQEYPTLLLDLISACHERVSITVTSAISFEEWAGALGNPSLTHAIVDRLFHRAKIINIRPGRSYRTEGPYAPNLSQPEQDPS